MDFSLGCYDRWSLSAMAPYVIPVLTVWRNGIKLLSVHVFAGFLSAARIPFDSLNDDS